MSVMRFEHRAGLEFVTLCNLSQNTCLELVMIGRVKGDTHS